MVYIGQLPHNSRPAFKFRDRPCVRWMSIDTDYTRSNLPRAMESKLQEKLGCS
jgi:hypothetical protein